MFQLAYIKTILFTYLLLCFCHTGHAGFPPFTDIIPENITIDKEIFIGYDPLQSPCLQSLPNFQGMTQFIEIDNNNLIEITIVALGTSPCLNIGIENPPYQYYSLGELTEGDYTIQMYWTDNSVALPVQDPTNRIAIGDLLQFSVRTPNVVPTLNQLGLFLLTMIIILSIRRFK